MLSPQAHNRSRAKVVIEQDDGHPSGGAHPPVAAASAVLLRGGAVLLVERGAGAAVGRWSLPGGHIEPGETAEAAARREVREETGLVAGRLEPMGVHDVDMVGGDGRRPRRYAISVFRGVAPAGEPVAASDARAARFVDLAALAALPLTDGALSLIRRAFALTKVED